MRHFGTRWRRASAAALIAGLALGCVTRGTYDRVVDERNALAGDKRRLDERVRMLQASTESLDKERVALIEQTEQLQQAHDQLDHDVRRLRETERTLTENLSQREAELATRTKEVDQLRGTYEGLVKDLESEVASGQIKIEQMRDGLRLDMNEDVLFASGSAEVNAQGQKVLAKVAQRVEQVPNRIEVSGHTDDVPIHTARFPSNWELAASRATGVVRILAQKGVPSSRLTALSLADNAPIADNATAEGRARNRRIEIVLKPEEAVAAQPKAAPAPAAAASR